MKRARGHSQDVSSWLGRLSFVCLLVGVNSYGWIVSSVAQASTKVPTSHRNVANEVSPAGAIDEPKGCWSRGDFPCALLAVQSGTVWETPIGVRVVALAETGVVWISDQHILLLKGRIWAKSKEQAQVSSHGLRLSLIGEAYLAANGAGRLEVTHLSGTADLDSLRGLSAENSSGDSGVNSLSLLPGFQVWVETLQPLNSPLRMGVPAPVARERFLVEWNQVARKTVSELRDLARGWAREWSDAEKIASQIYQATIERRVASAHQAQVELEKQIKEKQSLQAARKRWAWERVFGR